MLRAQLESKNSPIYGLLDLPRDVLYLILFRLLSSDISNFTLLNRKTVKFIKYDGGFFTIRRFVISNDKTLENMKEDLAKISLLIDNYKKKLKPSFANIILNYIDAYQDDVVLEGSAKLRCYINELYEHLKTLKIENTSFSQLHETYRARYIYNPIVFDMEDSYKKFLLGMTKLLQHNIFYLNSRASGCFSLFHHQLTPETELSNQIQALVKRRIEEQEDAWKNRERRYGIKPR